MAQSTKKLCYKLLNGVIVLFISFLSLPAHAQNSKWQVGAYFSPDLNLQLADEYNYNVEKQRGYMDIGFTTGITGQYKLSKRFRFLTGLQYKYRRFEQVGDIGTVREITDSLKNTSFGIAGSQAYMVGIPLQLQYWIVDVEKFGFYVMGGYNVNWLTKETIGYGVESSKMFNTPYYYVHTRVSGFALSQWFNYAELGIGYVPRLSRRFWLAIQPTYRMRDDGASSLTRNIGMVFHLSYQL